MQYYSLTVELLGERSEHLFWGISVLLMAQLGKTQFHSHP